MSKNKSLLLKSLKKTLAVGVPVMAISGFVPTAMNVGIAQAEGQGKAVVAEAKSEAESKLSKYGNVKSEAESKLSKYGKSEAEAGVSEAEAEAGDLKGQAEAGVSEAEAGLSEAKAEAEKNH